MKKTFDFFEMAEIYRRTAILPDSIQVCDGFKQNGQLMGIAVYDDETKLPSTEEMSEIVVDFKIAFNKVKSLVMQEIRKIEKEQRNESNRTTEKS